jgi:hypothetical protein
MEMLAMLVLHTVVAVLFSLLLQTLVNMINMLTFSRTIAVVVVLVLVLQLRLLLLPVLGKPRAMMLQLLLLLVVGRTLVETTGKLSYTCFAITFVRQGLQIRRRVLT